MADLAKELKQRLEGFKAHKSIRVVRIELTTNDVYELQGSPDYYESTRLFLAHPIEVYAGDIEPCIVWTQDGHNHFRSTLAVDRLVEDAEDQTAAPSAEPIVIDIPGLFRLEMGPF